MMLINFFVGLVIGHVVYNHVTKDWKIGIPICMGLSIIASSILHFIKYIINN